MLLHDHKSKEFSDVVIDLPYLRRTSHWFQPDATPLLMQEVRAVVVNTAGLVVLLNFFHIVLFG